MERLEQEEERFDEVTQERILHIAAEFQREEASTLSRNQLELAAAEAGIDPKHVRRAIESLKAEPVPDQTQFNFDRDRLSKVAVIGTILGMVLLSTGNVPLVMLVVIGAAVCLLLARQDGGLLRSLTRRCVPIILALTPICFLIAGRLQSFGIVGFASFAALETIAILLAYLWARRVGLAEGRRGPNLRHRA